MDKALVLLVVFGSIFGLATSNLEFFGSSPPSSANRAASQAAPTVVASDPRPTASRIETAALGPAAGPEVRDVAPQTTPAVLAAQAALKAPEAPRAEDVRPLAVPQAQTSLLPAAEEKHAPPLQMPAEAVPPPPVARPALAVPAPAPAVRMAASLPASPSVAADHNAPRLAVPDTDRIILLIRTALLSLNDAMRTGNYTVLRDIGGPAFREANSAARLSQIFGNLGAQGVDLSMVAVMAPQLVEVPSVDARNTLRLKGYFPGKPVQMNFDIVYEAVGGHWRLFGLSVAAAPSAPASPEASAKTPATPNGQHRTAARQ